MAMGVYLGPGSLKELKSCYVGAGGVKTVSEIYVGVGGTAYKVWPSYTDYGGDTVNMMGSTDFIARGLSFDWEVTRTTRTYSGATYAYTGYTSDTNWNNIAGGGESGATSWSGNGAHTHWYMTTAIDTRGYNYIMMRFMADMYNSGANNLYLSPGISYATSESYTWSTISTHLNHSSSAVNGRGMISWDSSDFERYCKYVLYDITNINLESCYVFFGGKVSNGSSDTSTKKGQLVIDTCKLYQSKPSGADITFAY